jgi:hypothetical protein
MKLLDTSTDRKPARSKRWPRSTSLWKRRERSATAALPIEAILGRTKSLVVAQLCRCRHSTPDGGYRGISCPPAPTLIDPGAEFDAVRATNTTAHRTPSHRRSCPLPSRTAANEGKPRLSQSRVCLRILSDGIAILAVNDQVIAAAARHRGATDIAKALNIGRASAYRVLEAVG